jgi:hypothetical protein
MWGAVAADENAVGVEFVVGVAADMMALIDDQDLLIGAGEAFCNHVAGKASAYN